MAKISRDLDIPSGGLSTLHPRETIIGTGTLGGVNAEVVIPCDGCASFSFDARNTAVMTIELSGSVDSVNWTPIPVRQLNVAAVSYVAAITYTVGGVWVGSCGGFRLIRARVTAYTSGSAAATLVASIAPLDLSLVGMVTPSLGTNTGASGAAVTLTLASPGAGLRHYITYLSVNRFAAATLTAAATPILVTTTNLPGSLVISVPIEAAAQGTMDRWREDFSFPLAASAQATATTIVAPVTTGVIWRITAGFYVAP